MLLVQVMDDPCLFLLEGLNVSLQKLEPLIRKHRLDGAVDDFGPVLLYEELVVFNKLFLQIKLLSLLYELILAFYLVQSFH
jgi:hypothetical protein